MISYTEARNLYGSLSQNTSATNLALFDKIANIEHRYLLQKYYSNEGSFSMTTVGAQSLTTTAPLALGATSATLNDIGAATSTGQLSGGNYYYAGGGANRGSGSPGPGGLGGGGGASVNGTANTGGGGGPWDGGGPAGTGGSGIVIVRYAA